VTVFDPLDSASTPGPEAQRPLRPGPAAIGARSPQDRLPAIAASGVAVTYEEASQTRPQCVELTIDPGETVLVLGPSGCGKSTFALTLNGLIPHSVPATLDGRVVVAGIDTSTSGPAELTRQIGMVFQDPDAQLVTMTVADEVAFGLENLRVDPQEMEAHIGEALAMVGLSGREHESPDRLSGGERQRLAFASVLALEPSILVLDEPTANLDPAGTREVFALIERLAADPDRTVVLIEHDLDGCIDLVDRVVALDAHGTVLADGPPADVFAHRGDQLAAAGVWLPETVRLARLLKRAGVPVDPLPVTLAQGTALVAGLVEGGHRDSAAPQGSGVAHPSPSGPGTGLSAPSRLPPGNPMTDVVSADPSSPAVAVRDLHVRLGEREVLRGIDLEVAGGEVVAIVGSNGAGKTTLARAMMGLVAPASGTVHIGERDLRRMPALELCREVGYVFQNPEHQFVTERVADELAFGLRLRGLDDEAIDERVEGALTRFGLTESRDASPFTLSHGQKRRLSVATMLVAGQRTLILDEPTFGQDAANADALLALLRELNDDGVTIILITHDMRIVAEHADRALVLDEGALRFDGTPEELFDQAALLVETCLERPPIGRLLAPLVEHHRHLAGIATIDRLVAALTTGALQRGA
jgi:energy-coupling factor transporter ATP-binding protein EcfA2